jgi:uncharacterized membrane protein
VKKIIFHLFLSCLVVTSVQAQGIQINNVFECYGDNSKKNLAQKIRIKVNIDATVLNWKDEMWLLKYENQILDKNGDYVYQYGGHLFLLQISNKYLNILDTKTKKVIFSDFLLNCKSVEYVSS